MAPTLAEWLQKLNLERYASVFIENEVDFETLRVLSEGDLIELGLPFGPRKRLLKEIASLQQPSATAPAPAEMTSASTGERRQLTVLFCDMVGFTEQAHRLDPEVLQGVVHGYEDACAICITRYNGYVFQRLGDGIVAFFGFPLAHEGEVERAIRAGLEILESMARNEFPEAGYLRVRIGIATGIVVVEPGTGGAVGETMNLASRLQTLAEPGSLVVSDRVRHIAGGAFEFEDLGERHLKGIDRPNRVWRVLGLAPGSRFDALAAAGLTPMVGRDREIAMLLDRWRHSRQGSGEAVLLWGEPGVGKSRLLRALCERLPEEEVRFLRLNCSPFAVHSPFSLVIALLERAIGAAREEAADVRLDRLEALAARFGQPREKVRFLAAMLSIPHEDRYGRLQMTPQLAKAETFLLLVEMLRAAAEASPVLLLVEDLQWADASTLELLDRLIAQLEKIPLLAVLTSRPEFVSLWPEHPAVTSLELSRLNSEESLSLIAQLGARKPLPPELTAQILTKTDGVPLFIEELTRAILESGSLVEEGDRYSFNWKTGGFTIPETLRDSLTARLDRVPEVREIAHISAAIGREFSYELLAALELMPEAALRRKLAQLTESGLAFQSGIIPGAVFTFKHALVQEVAYDSMLRSQRQDLHARIARVLEERWPEIKETEPALLAHHYAEAGLGEEALAWWQRAGELALKRFALPEALGHLRNGMALLKKLPFGPARDRVELALRTTLAPAVVAYRGWAHADVADVLEPAWNLAETLNYRSGYLPILNALWVHYLCRDQLAVSLEWAEKLLKAGAELGDDGLEIVGRRAASASHFWKGDFAKALQQGNCVHDLYDANRHWGVAELTNYDPISGEGIYRGQILWMLGHPDQALAATLATEAHARARNHPFDLAFALTLGAQVFDFLGEPDELLRRTDEAERIGREHGVPLLNEVMAEISRGIGWLRAGRIDESIAQLGKAIRRIQATGHRIWIWYLQGLQAEGLALAGDAAKAAELLEESVAVMRRGEERAHFAEVLRLSGWVLLRQGRIEEAEARLQESLEVARAQRALSWHLRSATTWAGLLAERGETGRAKELLAPVAASFTEGFATRDFGQARALLEML